MNVCLRFGELQKPIIFQLVSDVLFENKTLIFATILSNPIMLKEFLRILGVSISFITVQLNQQPQEDVQNTKNLKEILVRIKSKLEKHMLGITGTTPTPVSTPGNSCEGDDEQEKQESQQLAKFESQFLMNSFQFHAIPRVGQTSPPPSSSTLLTDDKILISTLSAQKKIPLIKFNFRVGFQEIAQKLKAPSNNETIDAENRKKTKNEVNITQFSVPEAQFCNKHRCPKTYFCTACEKFVCDKCLTCDNTSQHQKSNFITISEFNSILLRNISEKKRILKEINTELSEKTTNLNSEWGKLEQDRRLNTKKLQVIANLIKKIEEDETIHTNENSKFENIDELAKDLQKAKEIIEKINQEQQEIQEKAKKSQENIHLALENENQQLQQQMSQLELEQEQRISSLLSKNLKSQSELQLKIKEFENIIKILTTDNQKLVSAVSNLQKDNQDLKSLNLNYIASEKEKISNENKSLRNDIKKLTNEMKEVNAKYDSVVSKNKNLVAENEKMKILNNELKAENHTVQRFKTAFIARMEKMSRDLVHVKRAFKARSEKENDEDDEEYEDEDEEEEEDDDDEEEEEEDEEEEDDEEEEKEEKEKEGELDDDKQSEEILSFLSPEFEKTMVPLLNNDPKHESLFNKACKHLEGRGNCKKNLKKARQIMKMVMTEGFCPAAYYFGWMMSLGYGMKKDEDSAEIPMRLAEQDAKKYFKEKAEKENNEFAWFALGEMAEREMFRVEGMKDREMWKTMTKEIMENDKITTKDPEFMKKRQIAIDFFERAAAQSNSLALVELAFLHDIIGKNYEAVEYTKKAAELGNQRAQSRLGKCYREGVGVNLNFSKAFEWFQKSEQQNSPDGTFGLAELYAAGDGVKKDVQKAILLYKKSGDLGSSQGKLAFEIMKK